MGKIAEKKEKKRNALLDTAFELFTGKGFSQTSVSDIVKEAGVAKGTFYLYFKDKDDIRNRLISSRASLIFQDALLETDCIPARKFEERVIAIIDHILDSFEQNHTLLILISKHLSWGIFKNALTAGPARDKNSVYHQYTEFFRASGHQFVNQELMIYMIIELVSGVSYNAILFEQPESIEGIKPFLYETVRNIIHQFTAPA